ncbi:MAG TPA: protein kinase, partial [Spirochaetota bacterium]|nr:protein kinase [Spirochaetota bacterium]
VRLKKEVELVNKLPIHPNIAYYEECYSFESFTGNYDFAVLQYYEQGNLLQLTQRQNLSMEQKQSTLRQILSGIDFLHTQGIIHRDIKPQNILIVNRNGEYIPKITDFGISKQLDINKSAIFSNSLAGAGTLSYASPEQLGSKEIRKNTDLWSFGVIAFWMLTGKLPFDTGGHPATSEAARAELFRQINSGKLPAEIQQIAEPWQTAIRQCLVHDPAQRLRKASEIETILAGSPTTKTEIIPPAEIAKGAETQTAPEPTLKEPVTGDTEQQAKQKPEIILLSLSTGSASNLSETSASISGNISNSGNGTISERGIVYSTGSNPTTSSNKLRSGSGTGNFTAILSSLQSNTKYYARAYAINEAG